MPGMSQTLHLVAHTPTAELERLYKAAATVIERRRLLAVAVLGVNACLLVFFAYQHAQGTIIS